MTLDVWAMRGTVLGRLGRVEDALRSLDEAPRLDPENLIDWLNKGNRLGELGRHTEALVCQEKAISLNPTRVRAW
jgi:tetratricopeptide (TPR) repeat protein